MNLETFVANGQAAQAAADKFIGSARDWQRDAETMSSPSTRLRFIEMRSGISARAIRPDQGAQIHARLRRR